MRQVDRKEIVDYATYEETREAFRSRVMEVKRPRRVHVGEAITLLFENTLTIRYQIQEMMRAEKIVREADILHEIETYNDLLGGPGELGSTLLIEIDDPRERDEKLVSWFALPEHIYLLLPDGTKVRPRFDETQRGEGRLSSVQYLKFDVKGQAPVAAGVDLPSLTAETRLTAEQRAALEDDLAGAKDRAPAEPA
jgi:hypothetical protein